MASQSASVNHLAEKVRFFFFLLADTSSRTGAEKHPPPLPFLRKAGHPILLAWFKASKGTQVSPPLKCSRHVRSPEWSSGQEDRGV